VSLPADLAFRQLLSGLNALLRPHGFHRSGQRYGRDTKQCRQIIGLQKSRLSDSSVDLDPTRVDRDAGRIADEVISHLAGLMGSRVTVTLEIQAEVSSGVPDKIARTVTENCRTLKFKDQGFEET